GLAAAVSAFENGCTDILVIERDNTLGGILNQCIHNGFGLHTFHEELTGPEYSARFEKKMEELHIPYVLNTMVVDLQNPRCLTVVSREHGLKKIFAKAIILAMGCRERSRGALNIPGFRPAGVFSAGTAQRLVNMEGYMPGKTVVILGSGDIGLIMARRLTLEGATVKLVAELQPFSGGLKRNIVQCLEDYHIPLRLSHTVTEIRGKERVEGVTVSRVDERLNPIPGTEEYFPCDTLLLSVGLIPENELSRALGVEMENVTSGPKVNESLETSAPGVFACGNVLHVHDLVDFVSEEAAAAGKNAAKFVREGETKATRVLTLLPTNGVRYTVPQTIHPENAQDNTTVRFRVGAIYKDKYLSVYLGDKRILHRKKQILAPGEMESVSLKKSDLLEPGFDNITITLED
ncbi:MAG: NAD(P)/FAD-dependent oxidoreductase, partial [Oscillospiraceae bacterium]